MSDILTLHEYEEVGETLYKRYTECKEQILTTEVYHSSVRTAFANGFRYQGQPILIQRISAALHLIMMAAGAMAIKMSTKKSFCAVLRISRRQSSGFRTAVASVIRRMSDVQQRTTAFWMQTIITSSRLRQSEKSMNARWGIGGQRCNKSLLRFPHNTIIVIGKDYNRKWRDCNAAA